jgi:hypothetical protein
MSANKFEGIASRTAKLIAIDISDRSGLGSVWDEFDDEMRAEIISQWRELMIEQLELQAAFDAVKEPECICPEHAHDEACPACIPGSGLIVPLVHVTEISPGKEEGDTCGVVLCMGKLKYPKAENCSCHINPPCAACTDVKLTCDKCGRIVDDL